MKRYFLGIVTILFVLKLYGQDHFEKSILPNAGSLHQNKYDKAQPMYNPLSDRYDVKFYKIDLEVQNTSVYLEGSATIGAVVTASILDTFVAELHPEYTIDSIIVNGTLENFARDYDDIIIPLTSSLAESEWIETQIFYHGAIEMSFSAGIMHSDIYGVTYTLTEPLYAKDWFPCKQVLTDKADSASIFITTGESLKVGSNGLLTNVVPLGGGKIRHEWKTYYPIAYYLISMAVGDYYEFNIYAKPEGLEDSILIQNYLYDASYLSYYKDDIDKTAELIEIFSELFGMYPFPEEKYGHCMAPIGGGMEHQTMTTISSFNFMLVAHELAHMWFGDYVTCGTWQDIWINEGFATYCHLLALEHLNGVFPTSEMQGYHSDQIGFVYDGSIFIPASQFDIDYSREIEVYSLTGRIFDWYLSYEKGAIILHMLRYELNDDEMFFSILRAFLSQYKFSNAIGTDFKAVAENISGKDLTDFFSQWYFGEGYPVYDIQWFQESDTVYFRSIQTSSAPSTPLFRMTMDYRLVYSGNDTIIRLYQGENEQIHRVYFPEPVTRVSIDPGSWVLKNIHSLEEEEFPVGISTPANDEQRIQLYPNPVKEKLTVRINNDLSMKRITLYTSTGQVITSFSTEDQAYEFDISSLDNGLYCIEIITASERFLKKIVKL